MCLGEPWLKWNSGTQIKQTIESKNTTCALGQILLVEVKQSLSEIAMDITRNKPMHLTGELLQ